jgi:hypothetical protein
MPDFDKNKYNNLKADIKKLKNMLRELPTKKSTFDPIEYKTRIVYYNTILKDKQEDLKEMKKITPLWIRLRFW